MAAHKKVGNVSSRSIENATAELKEYFQPSDPIETPDEAMAIASLNVLGKANREESARLKGLARKFRSRSLSAEEMRELLSPKRPR